MVFEIRLHATTSQRLNRLVVLLSLSLGTLCIIIHIFHTHQTKTTNSSIPYCCCVMPSLFIWRRRNEKWNNITATSPPPTTTTRNRYPARDFAQCILITFFSKAKYNEQLSWNSHNTTWERYDVSQVINTMYSSIVSIPSHFFFFLYNRCFNTRYLRRRISKCYNNREPILCVYRQWEISFTFIQQTKVTQRNSHYAMRIAPEK